MSTTYNVSSNPPTLQKITLACIACLCFEIDLSSLFQYTSPTPVVSLHLIPRIQYHPGIPVTLLTGSSLILVVIRGLKKISEHHSRLHLTIPTALVSHLIGFVSDCLGSFCIYRPKSQEIGHVTIFPTVPYGPGLVGHEFTTKFISYF